MPSFIPKAKCFVALTFLIFIEFCAGSVVTFFDNPKNADTLIERAVLSVNSRYGPWTEPTAIPYRLSTSYNQQEISQIQAAMAQISTDMGQCIRFVPYNDATDQTKDSLFISPSLNNGSLTQTCFSFPGRLINQATANGVKGGQKLGMVSGTDGCLGSTREAMKYLAHSLGLRNEYLRTDRDTYITVFPQNIRTDLQGLSLLNIYTQASQVQNVGTFDYNSITMPSTTKYTTSGMPLYSVAQTGVPLGTVASIGTLSRLSQSDCTALASIYTTCSAASCANPYPGAVIPIVSPLVVTTAATPLQPINVGDVVTGVPVVNTVNPNLPVAPTVPTAPPTVATVAPVDPLSPLEPPGGVSF
ncbi:embryonic protein UVS.2-like [Paramacrobiotus metropolitanus]|uniref:embryonic protein UVS.2-like n=1 Tax=Paramacrobiotus metropolitanus TaxID=2943436 RepID=UPI0024464430|nr:embryonic protein UVS.2-like [Paramacrobiotus metropolitanus]